ncbi:MAG: hypothetical protein ACLGHP_10785, partial [Vicinamibacteria bacterium]
MPIMAPAAGALQRQRRHDQPDARDRRDPRDERVLLEPVAVREAPLLGGEQREHRAQRVQAEVFAVRDPHAVRLRDLEVV